MEDQDMKMTLEKPEAVCKAGETKKGLNWILEFLVFVAVFIVCSLGQMIILFPGELVMLLTNSEYLNAASTGDMNKIMEISMAINNTEGYMILSLFSDIILILLVLLFCRFLQKRKPDTLGFTKKGLVKEYLIGAAAGFAVFSLAVCICILTGSVTFNGISDAIAPGMLILFLLGYMIQGMAEEVLCRGYFLVSVARRYPIIVAILMNSLSFAALHLLNPGITPLAFLNLTLFGIFASLYFIKSGNLWGVGAFHSVWNFVQGNFYGIQVSGLSKTTSIFDTTLLEGKTFINGGAFGLEGGLAVTIVLVIGIVFFAFYQKRETAAA